jgi:hypothetical protein
MADENSNPSTNTSSNSDGSVPTISVTTARQGGKHSIRNIKQTAQEREVIKTAPDIIVYIDGKAYLINPYVNSGKPNPNNRKNSAQSFSYVNFNDHVQTFQVSYDTDTLIPSGNLTFQVPNHMKYLYQSPGGNNLLETMMEVQVYAKGYFPSGTGNTVYHRIFKGMTTNISHNDTGTVLQISVQCLGILHFLEFMFMDLNPAALTNSERPQQPMISNQSKMNPYEMLADVFNRGISIEGFQRTSIVQANYNKNKLGREELDWLGSIKAGYINKWQTILDNMRREVHILGYKMAPTHKANKDLPPPDSTVAGATQSLPEGVANQDPQLLASKFTITPAVSLVEQVYNDDYYIDIIRQYHMDLGIGSLQLVNGRITSRLERIRTIVQVLGYEGYQDVDGTVIFKPPLYNLDVTNVGSSIKSSSGGTIPSAVDIRDDTNPFIVHLSEIESESEGEDEQAVRATRVTTQPAFLPNSVVSNDATSIVRPAVSHIDIFKLAKFGLREEPARTIPWLSYGDKVAAYTYAVCELNRANRGWRTYNLTIPLRPELKLGFPMYLPHKDMYGYIKNISVSYQSGGAATMTVTLDSLRKRPVFPAKLTNSDGSATTVYTTQPNLVMQWTTPPAGNPSTTDPVITSGQTQQTATTNIHPAKSADGTVPTDSKAVISSSHPATQRQPDNKPVYQQDLEVISNRRVQWGTSWQTKADTKTKSFRPQRDVATVADTFVVDSKGKKHDTNIPEGKPFFSADNWVKAKPKFDEKGNPAYKTSADGKQTSKNQDTTVGVNIYYMQKILTTQPYTDEKGYEVISPFPWGRWKTLKEALLETRLGIVNRDPANTYNSHDVVQPVDSLNAQTITGTDVFLFAGLGSPQAIDPSNNLTTELSKLDDLSNFASNSTMFELVTPPAGTFPQSSSLSDTQPDSQVLSEISDVVSRSDFFVTGSNAPCTDFQALFSQTTTQSEDAVGVTPSTETQSQTFVSKLLNGNKSTE